MAGVKGKPKSRKAEPDNMAQSERFIKAAKVLGVAEDGRDFERTVDALLDIKPSKDIDAMANTIKKFGYEVVHMEKGDKSPFNPYVELILNDYFTSSKSEFPCVSAHLMTDGEIDHHIKALKDDLDAVGKKAKLALKRAQEKTMGIVSSRK